MYTLDLRLTLNSIIINQSHVCLCVFVVRRSEVVVVVVGGQSSRFEFLFGFTFVPHRLWFFFCLNIIYIN